jgi:hypothetical protein
MGTDGEVMNGTDFILGSNAPITLSLAGTGLGCDPTNPDCHDDGTEVSFTPEPGSALLYMSGLVLLVGFAKKRFGANSLT